MTELYILGGLLLVYIIYGLLRDFKDWIELFLAGKKVLPKLKSSINQLDNDYTKFKAYFDKQFERHKIEEKLNLLRQSTYKNAKYNLILLQVLKHKIDNRIECVKLTSLKIEYEKSKKFLTTEQIDYLDDLIERLILEIETHNEDKDIYLILIDYWTIIEMLKYYCQDKINENKYSYLNKTPAILVSNVRPGVIDNLSIEAGF